MLSRSRVCLATAVVAFVLCSSTSFGAANVELAGPQGLAGRVLSDRSPLSAARVYAYQVSDLSLTKATTGGDGTFLFSALPAGVYKIIAYKSGFVPAIALVTRAAQQAADYLEFELIAESQAPGTGAVDFWSVRRKIPTDVLRQIELAEMGLVDFLDDPIAVQAGAREDQEDVIGEVRQWQEGLYPLGCWHLTSRHVTT